MSKAKKIILIVVLILLTLSTIVNSLLIYALFWHVQTTQTDFFSIYSFLTPNDNFMKVEDIGYIRLGASGLPDDVIPSPEALENGKVRLYTYDEIRPELEAAAARRNAGEEQ